MLASVSGHPRVEATLGRGASYGTKWASRNSGPATSAFNLHAATRATRGRRCGLGALVAATSRALSSLKSDFVPRFRVKITAPSLDERREDVPLLARELARELAKDMPEQSARFVAAGDVRFSQSLMTTLVRHPYAANVRELDELLLRSLTASHGDELADIDQAPVVARDPSTLAAAEVRALLDAHSWNATRAAASIGIHRSSLLRRMKHLGVQRAK